MSMPIQRQSESFGYFDDGPRFARDRSSTDLPSGLAGLVNSMGPRIQAGLLNTREAINFGKGPRDHGGAGPDGGPALPDWYYDERDSDDEDDEDFGDPERFIPEHLVHGNRRGSRHPFDRAAAARLAGEQPEEEGGLTLPKGWLCHKCGTIHPSDYHCPLHERGDPDFYEPGGLRDILHDFDSEISSLPEVDHPDLGKHGSRAAARLAKDGGCTCWEGYERVPGTEPCASGSCRRRTAHRTAADAAVVDPAQMQVPMGGGYLPGHQVDLFWRPGSHVHGTVIGVNGPDVHVRWEDGQYSIEEPRNIHLH